MFHPNGPSFWELTRQVLSSTEKGYDLLADKFEYTPFRTPDPILETTANWVGDAGSVLDVCCGTGAALRCFQPRAARLVGIDFSHGMLAVAERLLSTLPGAVELHHGDVLNMPYRGAFDTVVCFGALGHIRARDEDRFLSGIYRSLKPGGRFIFVTGTMPPLSSWQYWFARAFNGAMHLRNLFLPARFVMFYLTFLWPEVGVTLARHGFRVACHSGLFDAPYGNCLLVEARVPTRP